MLTLFQKTRKYARNEFQGWSLSVLPFFRFRNHSNWSRSRKMQIVDLCVSWEVKHISKILQIDHFRHFHCQTNQSLHRIRLWQFKLLSHSVSAYQSLLNTYAPFAIVHKSAKYLCTWYPQLTANWPAHVRERKIKLLYSCLMSFMKTLWQSKWIIIKACFFICNHK